MTSQKPVEKLIYASILDNLKKNQDQQMKVEKEEVRRKNKKQLLSSSLKT